MKLHELNVTHQQDNIARVIGDRLGQPISFANLSYTESRKMLSRVRGLIREHKQTPSFHNSERNPAYLKLIMLEQGLQGQIAQGAQSNMPADEKYTQALTRLYGQQILRNPKFQALVAKLKQSNPNDRDLDFIIKTGTLPNHLEEAEPTVNVPVPANDPKVQGALKAVQSGGNLNPEQQKIVGAIATSSVQRESQRNRRRMVRESELQQAQVTLASQDMIDQIQKMLEQISEMQFKDLPALADSIKNDPNMGPEKATQYQSAAAAALTQLLAGVQQGKTALEGAQGTLTGQAPVVPGQNMGTDTGMPPEGGDELNPDADMDMPPEGGDKGTDELGNAVSLGRDRRGVAEAREGKLPSMSHIKKMCQDGKTVAEICKMHPDCDRGELKQMVADCKKKLEEAAKPDFLDMDKDGNKKEPFKKAVDDKKKNPFNNKKVR